MKKFYPERGLINNGPQPLKTIAAAQQGLLLPQKTLRHRKKYKNSASVLQWQL
jgi:hypothetical protein